MWTTSEPFFDVFYKESFLEMDFVVYLRLLLDFKKLLLELEVEILRGDRFDPNLVKTDKFL